MRSSESPCMPENRASCVPSSAQAPPGWVCSCCGCSCFAAPDPLPDPLGDAHLANLRDELLARQRYLQTVPCWTSKDVADAARHVNKNASSTAHRWKSDGKIFAIAAAGKRDVYPVFQFKDGKPREVIAELLEILEEARTPWEIAQWFVAANSWLDSDRPIDLLDDPDSRDLLIDAAEQEVATNVG